MPPALAVGRMLSTSLSPQRLGQVLGSVCWGWGQHSGTKAGMGNVLPPRCLSHQCHPLSPRGWWGVWGGGWQSGVSSRSPLCFPVLQCLSGSVSSPEHSASESFGPNKTFT